MPSDTYDSQTQRAVSEFQKKFKQKCSNLPVTGKVDKKTWNILNNINETCKLYE